ncbi:MAG: hypothetical protein CM15mP46_4670 [Alphaproteobacteria bacterium]|nr:MAG: hypothetical protein CM15mP46_4670 [Alphaproteobacteria bacterium]
MAAGLEASGVETHKRRASQMKVWLAQPPEDRIEKLSFLVDAFFPKGAAKRAYQCKFSKRIAVG